MIKYLNVIVMVLGLVMMSVACASLPEESTDLTSEIIEPEVDIDATIAAKLQMLQKELDAQAAQQSPAVEIAALEPTIAVKKTGQINVIVDPPGSGSVESQIAFDDEGVPIGTYTAQPASGYVFDGWKGDFAPSLVEIWVNDGLDENARKGPGGMAADASGNLYVVDSEENRVQVYDFSGSYIFSWGSGERMQESSITQLI